jgi:hypothetical protein
MTKPRQQRGRSAAGAVRRSSAATLGVSPNTFRRYVLPHVRSVKVGQVRIVPVAELGSGCT